MTCRNISPKIFSQSRSLEDAFRALGVLRQKEDGSGEAAPRLVFPEGYQPEDMPYLSGNDHLTFNVNPLFANGSEQLTCALKTLGYNADRARQIDTESNAITDDTDYEKYMANLSPQDAMTYNIYRTLSVVEYFRKDAAEGKPEVGGNTDGNPDLVTTKELDTWAWEVSGHDEKKFYTQGGDVVARMHSLVGLVTLLNSAAPATANDGIKLDSVKDVSLAAPGKGWRSGDQIFIDGKLAGDLTVPSSGNGALTIPSAKLPAGDHKVEVRRADGGVVLTPITVAETNVEDPKVKPLPPTDDKKALTGDDQPAGGDKPSDYSWLTHYALPALGLVTFGALGSYLISRNRGGNSPTGGVTPTNGGNNGPKRKAHPDAEAAINQEHQNDTGIPNKKTPKAATPPPLPKKPAPKPIEADDMDDVLADLEESKGNQTPTSGASPSNPSTNTVTADNVIIKGSTAEPVSGVSESVIRAQIVVQYRRFMSQGARDALQDGKPLPSGEDLINSKFSREVDELVDRVVSAYHQQMMTEDGKQSMKELWDNQRDGRDFIVRRGVPQNMLREVVGEYIKAHNGSSSPFAGGVGAEMRSEAERHSGETEFFERGMREMMKSGAL